MEHGRKTPICPQGFYPSFGVWSIDDGSGRERRLHVLRKLDTPAVARRMNFKPRISQGHVTRQRLTQAKRIFTTAGVDNGYMVYYYRGIRMVRIDGHSLVKNNEVPTFDVPLQICLLADIACLASQPHSTVPTVIPPHSFTTEGRLRPSAVTPSGIWQNLGDSRKTCNDRDASKCSYSRCGSQRLSLTERRRMRVRLWGTLSTAVGPVPWST